MMQNPDNLRVTAAAEALAVEAYRFVRTLPAEERDNLSLQIRKSACSVPFNIYEGCGKEGNRALLPFLHHSLGSATELQGQFRLVRKLQLGNQQIAESVADRITGVKRMLANLIKSIRAGIAAERRKRG